MQKMRRPQWWISLLTGLVLLLPCLHETASAQGLNDETMMQNNGRVANFRFADPSELTIIVSLLGAVGQPGRYEISRSVDLMNLLALSGGWTDAADLSDVHIGRMSGNMRVDLKLDLGDFEGISRASVPLQHGDFIYVGKKSSFNADKIITWVTAVAILATTYITVSDRQR
jgi:hypothetical protein